MTPEQIERLRAEACEEVIDSNNFVLITHSEGEFAVSHHVSAENLAKFIGWLEVVKLDMVETINEAGEDA